MAAKTAAKMKFLLLYATEWTIVLYMYKDFLNIELYYLIKKYHIFYKFKTAAKMATKMAAKTNFLPWIVTVSNIFAIFGDGV